MVRERLQALRERVQRREKDTRAKRRARSRRIEREEPEGVAETAQAKSRQAREEAELTADEARGLAGDAKTLIATELGVSRDEAESLISEGSSMINSLGDNLDQLDFDADGDTDILNAMEPLGGGGDSSGSDADSGLYDPMNDDDPFM